MFYLDMTGMVVCPADRKRMFQAETATVLAECRMRKDDGRYQLVTFDPPYELEAGCHYTLTPSVFEDDDDEPMLWQVKPRESSSEFVYVAEGRKLRSSVKH